MDRHPFMSLLTVFQCAMEPCLQLKRLSPHVWLEPRTARSEGQQLIYRVAGAHLVKNKHIKKIFFLVKSKHIITIHGVRAVMRRAEWKGIDDSLGLF